MKRLIVIFILLVLLVGCQSEQPIDYQEDLNPPINSSTILEQQEETLEMKKILMIVENQEFEINLYQNEAVHHFISQLPLTIQMNDLYGNEKYSYLNFSLPTQSESIRNIQAGDIMLFGNNCLVLFYEDFTTSYQYTRIGYMDNADNIKSTVGNHGVTITFQGIE